jgi:hypothetical protein
VSSITDNLLNELVFLSVFSTHPLFINKSRRSAYLDEESEEDVREELGETYCVPQSLSPRFVEEVKPRADTTESTSKGVCCSTGREPVADNPKN